jgi:hypothetical protein
LVAKSSEKRIAANRAVCTLNSLFGSTVSVSSVSRTSTSVSQLQSSHPPSPQVLLSEWQLVEFMASLEQQLCSTRIDVLDLASELQLHK